MDEAVIKIKQKTAKGWEFSVRVGELDYTVKLDEEYLRKLTGDVDKPEELIKKSFEFLLEREPKESILREFELSVIEHYFPEYPDELTMNPGK